MPELDGFELADMIRQHPRFQKNRDHLHFRGASDRRGPAQGLSAWSRGLHFRSRRFPNCCGPKSVCLPSCIASHGSWRSLNRELRRLSSCLMTAQDEERRRIARDLHDGFGQELAAAKMMLDGLLQQSSVPSQDKTVSVATEIIDRAIQQVRSMSHLMHPPLLDEGGLFSALRWFVDGMTERTGIHTSLDLQPPEFPAARTPAREGSVSHRPGGFDQCVPTLGGTEGSCSADSKREQSYAYGSG